jgi:DNA processing protein
MPGGDDRLDKLRLIRSANIGPVSYVQLMRRFGSAAAALDAIPHLAERAGIRAPRLAHPDDVRAEMADTAAAGARHVFLGDADYPPLLAELDTAPPALIVKGDLSLAHKPGVALVGARNASAIACRFARQLAAGLAEAGIVVTSGLARGIDAQAHQGALDGGTIAVIASGIDIAYPPENAALQAEIARRGLLLSEQPPGREPLARHFPARNRIIAGLSRGVVVVEAAPKSGSLITARLANEAGRDVMAVPGSPLDPRAQGCNLLIRDGAILIQNVSDILETIQCPGDRVRQDTMRFQPEDPVSEPDDAARAHLMSLLSPVAVEVDELVRQSGLPPAIVQYVLLELDLAGRLERHAGGRVSLA